MKDKFIIITSDQFNMKMMLIGAIIALVMLGIYNWLI